MKKFFLLTIALFVSIQYMAATDKMELEPLAKKRLKLEPYKINSCQIDSIINHIIEEIDRRNDRSDAVIILTAYKREDGEYIIYAFLQPKISLQCSTYSGYTKKGETLVLFQNTDILDFLEEDTQHDSLLRSFWIYREPQPNPKTHQYDTEDILDILPYYCESEWTYILKQDSIELVEGIVNGQYYAIPEKRDEINKFMLSVEQE